VASPLKKLPWPVRSTMAGTAGTAALTAAYKLEHRLRPGVKGPVDYDDSLVPGTIVANILHLPAVTGSEENELGLALRWSYGSVFGIWHGILRRRFPEPWASVLFGSTLMSATFSLFPVLGHTPPPWRWPRGYLATSLFTHVAYVTTLAAVDDRLRG
jgi:hypothetical protein